MGMEKGMGGREDRRHTFLVRMASRAVCTVCGESKAMKANPLLDLRTMLVTLP